MLAIGTAGTHLRCVSRPVPHTGQWGTKLDTQACQNIFFFCVFQVAEGVERRGNDAAEIGHL